MLLLRNNQYRLTATAIFSATLVLTVQFASERILAQEQGQAAAGRAQSSTPASRIRRIGSPTATPIPQPTVVLKPGEKPAIKFETLRYNFGRVRAGVDVLHDFPFTNTGTGDLELLRVKPSCVCTSTGQYPHIVHPGKRGALPVKIDTTKLSGDIKKSVIIHTNAQGEQAKLIIEMTGKVWQPFVVSPVSAAFGQIDQGKLKTEKPSLKLIIYNQMDKPVITLKARSNIPPFDVKVKTLKAGKKYELTVSVTSKVGQGLNHGSIFVETGLPEKPILRIPASIYVLTPINILPSRLWLPSGRSQDIQRSIFVINSSNQVFVIHEVKTSNPAIHAEVSETKPGMEFQITVDIPASYEVPAKGDQIIVTTSLDVMPTITIPIIGPAMSKH